jgi:hypothetical protein
MKVMKVCHIQCHAGKRMEWADGVESAPPLSVYYPPSSHSSFTKLVPTALPPKSLSVSLPVWTELMDRTLQ